MPPHHQQPGLGSNNTGVDSVETADSVDSVDTTDSVDVEMHN